jgi:hypothetical protein
VVKRFFPDRFVPVGVHAHRDEFILAKVRFNASKILVAGVAAAGRGQIIAGAAGLGGSAQGFQAGDQPDQAGQYGRNGGKPKDDHRVYRRRPVLVAGDRLIQGHVF